MIVPVNSTQLPAKFRKSSALSSDPAKRLIALAGVIMLAVVISPIASDGSRIFLDAGNLTDILRRVSIIGIISLGMTFVILTASIDLGVGSILAFSMSPSALALTRFRPNTGYGTHLIATVLLASAGAALAGALNGVVIAFREIQPFVVTLASMIGFRGLTKRLTQNANIDIGFGQDVAAEFASVSGRRLS
jgi:ribose transport system permease protein